MLTFCEEIENKPQLRNVFHKNVEQIADWYSKSVNEFAAMLRTELGVSTMLKSFENMDDLSFSSDLSYAFSSKLSYFSVSDALVKLILSRYSYGPTDEFFNAHGIVYKSDVTSKFKRPWNNDSWLAFDANELVMKEILAKTMRDSGDAIPFDLRAFMIDRSARSSLTHSTTVAPCLSAIRCYQNIRRMLVFLDPDYESILPTLDDSHSQPALSQCGIFDFDSFLSSPCNFDFNDCTTVLVADSFHDIPRDQLSFVANLPWDLVVDFDAYSDKGGLLANVTHNCIQKDVLTRTTAKGPQGLRMGTTLWYRCGEYQFDEYIPGPNAITIPEYTYFHKDAEYRGNKMNNRDKERNMEGIFGSLLSKTGRLDKVVNIVVLSDDLQLVRILINKALDELGDSFFITWVGISSKDEEYFLDEGVFDSYDEMNSCFRYFNCLSKQFFEVCSKYSTRWSPRARLQTSFSLPGKDGPVVLSENERNNLAPFFDVLFDGCEHFDDAREAELANEFYHGNKASWNTIASESVVCIKDLEIHKQQIRSYLGSTQSNPHKRLLFINHAPGMGGTTLARQLVWALHKEFAVLEVKKYEPLTLTHLLENLYDNTLNKGQIVLLAEDTLAGIKSLCDDICRLERRCMLIVACRQTNILPSAYPQAYKIDLNSMNDESITKLCTRFRAASNSTKAAIQQKDSAFAREVAGNMRTPFIIGLYYMEEEFNIENYVSKAMCGKSGDLYENQYLDAMACIALCDKYNSKNVPLSFVRTLLNMQIRENLFYRIPTAESIITREYTAEGIEVLHFKHALLANKYLDIYTRVCYGSPENSRDAIYNLTRTLIQTTAKMAKNKSIQESHIDILINVMIQNKDDIVNGQGLSSLMMDIGMPEYQRQLMEFLAEQFKPCADEIRETYDPEEPWTISAIDRMILRLVSHAYAHLGKMYSRGDRNYTKAEEMHQLATQYMPDYDPNVYHMAGTSIMEKLKNTWYDWPETSVSDEQFASFDMDVRRAKELFCEACDCGSPDYGIPSILDLLFSYLRFIYRIKGIHGLEDLSRLSTSQRQLQMDFLTTLEEAKSYSDLDDRAVARIEELSSNFESSILYDDYGKTVEYYQNKVDRNRTANSIVELESSLRGLVFARISAARAASQDIPFYENVKNPRQLIDDIAQLINQPYNSSSFAEYASRTRLFHYWMELAKLLNYSIDSGLATAKRWVEMEDRNKGKKNPEPYYYLKVLLYLNGYSGSKQAMEELHEVDERVSRFASDNRFDARRGNRVKIRDLFVTGKDMGQLFSISHCRGLDEIQREIIRRSVRPMVFNGHLHEIQYTNGIIELYQPYVWSGEKVWTEIGKRVDNSLSEMQLQHKVSFFGGFSFDRMTALPNTVRDTSADESFSIDDFLGEWKKLYKQQPTKQSSVSTTSSSHKPYYVRSSYAEKQVADTGMVDATTTSAESRNVASDVTPANVQAISNGTGCKISIISISGSDVHGTFVQDGVQYKTIAKEIKGKTLDKMKKAQKTKALVPARVIGYQPNGTYLVKIV